MRVAIQAGCAENRRRCATKKPLYLRFLIAACLFSLWQYYELAKWRAEVVTRHPGGSKPWER